jgi:hypothetical protein
MTDIDSLPPTQQLILAVLAARHRLGEQVWTFPSAVNPALRALESRRLVTLLNGIVEKSTRARLTEAGRRLVINDRYRPPNGGVERYRQALQAILDYCEPRADIAIGLDGIIDVARQALEGGPR